MANWWESAPAADKAATPQQPAGWWGNAPAVKEEDYSNFLDLPPDAEEVLAKRNQRKLDPLSDSEVGAALVGGVGGYSAGLSDEIGAAGTALVSGGINAAANALGFDAPKESLSQIYERKLSQLREGSKELADKRPVAFYGADVAGSILSPVNKVVGPAGGLTKTIAQGAGLGAIHGFNRSEGGAAERITGAGIGGAAGGALGAAGYAAGKYVISPAAKKIASLINRENPADEGTLQAVQIMLDEGKSPQQIYNAAIQSKGSVKSGLPRTVFEESGGPVGLGAQQGLTEGKSPALAKGAGLMNEFNKIRETQAIPRVVQQTVQKGVSTTSPVTAAQNAQTAAKEVIEEAMKARTAAVAPKYSAVMEKKIPEQWVGKLIDDNPAMRPFYGSAKSDPITQQLLADEARVLGVPELAENSVGFLNVIAKRMGGAIQEAKASGNRETVKALTSARTRLLQKMDMLNPKYAEARKAYGDESEFVTSLQKSLLGNISRTKSEKQVYNAVFNDLPEKIGEARKLFVDAGRGQQWDDLTAAYITQLDDKSTGSAQSLVNKLARNDEVVARMRAALGKDAYKGHRLMIKNLQKIASGMPRNSQTVPKAQAMQYLEPKGSVLTNQIDNRGITARVLDLFASGAKSKLDAKAAARAQEKNYALAKAIISPDLAEYAKAIRGLTSEQQINATIQWLEPRLAAEASGQIGATKTQQ